jgi:hypothetical protein
MKKVSVILMILFSYLSFAQQGYKYVIVPEKYDFLEKNQYQVNTLTKSYFQTEGLTSFFDTDKLPKEIANNRCNAIFIDAKESNSLFVTKITIEIKDCQNTVLMTSSEGTSRDKDYKVAYTEAFRIALVSLKGKMQNLTPPLSSQEKVTVEVPQKEVPNTVVVENVTFDKEIILDEKLHVAKPMKNGYTLNTEKGEKIMDIYATTSETVFIGVRGTTQGVFMKKINGWFFEYYANDSLVSEPVKVKF